MTNDSLPLAELLQKAGDGDFLRAVAEAVLQILMESDVEGLIGAGRHERSPERLNDRNGYRDRTLDTRLGQLQLVGSGAPNPKAAPGFLLPALSRAPQDIGEGAGGGHSRLSRAADRRDRRGLDPPGRRAGPGPSAI